LETVIDWNIGMLEHWNGGKEDKKEEGIVLNFSNPVFHYSTIPQFQIDYGV
jgi:hypothetical protein